MEAMFTTVKPQLHKRPRHNNDDVDADDDDNSSSSISNSPRAKQLCSIPERAGPKLICTLPPTCSPPNKPSHLLNSIDLEKHYALYHAHVCEVKGCGCVFPEERLLELHLSECHDPLSEVRKERGERTFGCFLPPETRNRKFLNPKARRLHLIQAHGYPKQYFFAVTNKGIGGLLKKWGEGASLLRGEWKPRDNTKTIDVDMEDDDDEQQLRGEEDEEDLGGPTESSTPRGGTTAKGDALMEDLATNLQSVSLQVPTTIRFGRGGSTRGFVGKGSGGATARKPHPHQHHTSDSGGESYTNTSISMTGGENSSRAHSHPRPSRRSRGRGNGGTPSSLLSRTDANLSPKPNLTATQSAPSRRGPVPNSSFVTVNSRGRGRGKIWVANA